jgi:hypothetical protein
VFFYFCFLFVFILCLSVPNVGSVSGLFIVVAPSVFCNVDLYQNTGYIKYNFFTSLYSWKIAHLALNNMHLLIYWGHRDCVRMVVGFTTTCAISAYHHSVHGKVYLIQHYVIKFVCDLRQVGGFLRVLRFLPPIKLTATI